MGSPAAVRVMAADASEDVCGAIGRLLASDVGLEMVAAAHTEASALRLASEQLPDVILIDYNLPRSELGEFVRSLRERAPSGRVVVMLVHPTDASAAENSGADGWLLKDSGGQDLKTGIRTHAGTAPS